MEYFRFDYRISRWPKNMHFACVSDGIKEEEEIGRGKTKDLEEEGRSQVVLLAFLLLTALRKLTADQQGMKAKRS